MTKLQNIFISIVMLFASATIANAGSSVVGGLTADWFNGDGSNLTGISAGGNNATINPYNMNASNITSGTLPAARYSTFNSTYDAIVGWSQSLFDTAFHVEVPTCSGTSRLSSSNGDDLVCVDIVKANISDYDSHANIPTNASMRPQVVEAANLTGILPASVYGTSVFTASNISGTVDSKLSSAYSKDTANGIVGIGTNNEINMNRESGTGFFSFFYPVGGERWLYGQVESASNYSLWIPEYPNGNNRIQTANTILMGSNMSKTINSDGTITLSSVGGEGGGGNITSIGVASPIINTGNSTNPTIGITTSLITSVGTITSGTWSATDIAITDGGTGASTAGQARDNLGINQSGINGQLYAKTTAGQYGSPTMPKLWVDGGGYTYTEAKEATSPFALIAYKNDTSMGNLYTQTVLAIMYDYGGTNGAPWAQYIYITAPNHTEGKGASGIAVYANKSNISWMAAVHGQIDTVGNGTGTGIAINAEVGTDSSISGTESYGVVSNMKNVGNNLGAGVKIIADKGSHANGVLLERNGSMEANANFTNWINLNYTVQLDLVNNALDGTPNSRLRISNEGSNAVELYSSDPNIVFKSNIDNSNMTVQYNQGVGLRTIRNESYVTKIEDMDGNIELTTAGKGIQLVAPNSTVMCLTVTNFGTASLLQGTC